MVKKVGYITEDKINEFQAVLQTIIEETPNLVPPTPGHPQGEARVAWSNQAKYWLDKIGELVPGAEITFKDSAMLGFAALFASNFRDRYKNDLHVPDMVFPDKPFPPL